MAFVTCALQSVARPAAGELIAISSCTIASCRVWRRFLASPSAGVSLFSGSITALYESAATGRKPARIADAILPARLSRSTVIVARHP